MQSGSTLSKLRNVGGRGDEHPKPTPPRYATEIEYEYEGSYLAAVGYIECEAADLS